MDRILVVESEALLSYLTKNKQTCFRQSNESCKTSLPGAARTDACGRFPTREILRGCRAEVTEDWHEHDKEEEKEGQEAGRKAP